MRIFIFLLSLAAACAFVVLNVLGYNGTLSQIQFILISGAAEILLCFILGHFMFRTYANHKRAKTLSKELTSMQAALQVQPEPTAAPKEPKKEQTPSANPQKGTDIVYSSEDFKKQRTLHGSALEKKAVHSNKDADATNLFQRPLH